jgi:hypothetical protein
MRQDSLAAWGLLGQPLSTASPPAFAYAFIYIEKEVNYKTGAIRKIERRQSHDHRFRDQIDPGFLPWRRGSEAVFTAIFTAFIFIKHELHLHHHVCVVLFRHVRWMEIG